MKTQTLITAIAAAVALTVANPALAAGDHHQVGDDHKPRHGGVVAPTKAMDFELVARPTAIHLYLRDHGKPVEIAKASGKLTLLTGAEKQEVELKPAGDKLEAKGNFKVGPGTKAVAVVSNNGKTMGTARFTLP
jgi:hypothetical protein